MARRRDSDRLSSASLQRGTFCLIAGDARRHQRGWPLPPKGAIFERATSSMGGRAAMPTVKMTQLCAGLLVSAVGLAVLLASPANAERVHKKQGSYHSPRPECECPRGHITGLQRCCTKMGADPDPFIRSQILRDASGFFGGLD